MTSSISGTSSSSSSAAAPFIGPVLPPAQAQINLNHQLAQNRLNIHHDIRNNVRAYEPKQREWKEWCTEKGFPPETRFTVAEDKLLLFLNEKVIGRERRGGQGGTIRSSTVESYTSALIDLYNHQKSLGVNAHPQPRSSLVKDLLKNIKRNENQIRRDNYEDRGVGTFADGYSSVEELKRIANKFLEENNPKLFRDRAAFLLCHSGTLRGESSRMLELADSLHLELPNEGFQDCYAFICMLHQGKMNQFGRREYCASLRAKEVEICSIGATALYFFWRFQLWGNDPIILIFYVLDEGFPDMSTSRDWFQIKFMRKWNGSPTDELRYDPQYRILKRIMISCGHKTRQVTHAMRGSSARIAELVGASDGHIRRQGRWNTQAMEGCYLTSIPREAVRALAGFVPDRPTFYLARASVTPPQALLEMVWPDIEHWEAQIRDGDAEETIAATAFLAMMKFLRVVLLQDSVYLKEKFPNLSIWNNPVFTCQDYQDYRQELLLQVEEEVPPAEITLEAAMPDLTDMIRGQHQQLMDKINTLQSSIDVNQRLLDDLTSGNATFTLSVPRRQTASQVLTNNNAQGTGAIGSSISTNVAAQVVLSTPNITNTGGMPDFKMNRLLVSVKNLWKEYTEGFPGGYAVRQLEADWGTAWRKNPTESRFFNRRMVIIREIKRLQREEGKTESQAVDLLDRRRGNNSLDWLQNKIKDGTVYSNSN